MTASRCPFARGSSRPRRTAIASRCRRRWSARSASCARTASCASRLAPWAPRATRPTFPSAASSPSGRTGKSLAPAPRVTCRAVASWCRSRAWPGPGRTPCSSLSTYPTIPSTPRSPPSLTAPRAVPDHPDAMDNLIVHVLTALLYASVLFLIAGGLSLIYGVMRIVNLAHGMLYAFGAYVSAWAVGAMVVRWPTIALYALLPVGALAAAGLGAILEPTLLRPFYRRAEEYQLLVTFGLLLILGDLMRFLWGPS